ncbi:MAG: ABC transporter permease [bacterium]|nr:ABC transporter permease [bacterium]
MLRLVGLRALSRRPGSSALAILGLALGLGINTAAFSVLYGVLWRPLPFQDPDRLYLFYEEKPAEGRLFLSLPALREWRQRSRSFEALSGTVVVGPTVTVGDRPETVRSMLVSENHFRVLGISPQLGRTFSPFDDVAGAAAPEAILMDGFWRSRFGADPGVLGRPLRIGESTFTVVGVLPRGYGSPRGTQVFLPLPMVPVLNPNYPGLMEDPEARILRVYARRKKGFREAETRLDVERVARQLAADFPATHQGVTGSLTSYREATAGGVRRHLVLLQAGAVMVLLVVCANLANLLLAQGVGRARELALRSALGAAPARLFRQLLGESLVLSLAGGVLGIGIAFAMTRILIATSTGVLPLLAKVSLDVPVLLAAVATAVLAGLAAGSLPALRVSRVDVNLLLQATAPPGGKLRPTARHFVGQRGLIVLETALTVALLVAGGLLARSLLGLARVDPGFSPQGVLVFSVALSGDRYSDPESLERFYGRLLEELEHLPGVQAVGGSLDIPSQGASCSVRVTGEEASTLAETRELECQMVAPGYRATLDIPLLAGRDLERTDYRTGGLSAILINKRLADQRWPGMDPVGRRLTFEGGRRLRGREVAEVVGVIGNVRHRGVDREVEPMIYLPEYGHFMSFFLRTEGEVALLAEPARKALWRVDPRQPVYRVTTLAEALKESTATTRFSTYLLSLIAVFSMLISAIGLFGVLSYHVSQQRRSIAIRMALGATAREVSRVVVGEALVLTGVGCLLGLMLAWPGGRLIASLLYGVGAFDAVTLAAVVLLMLIVALVASFDPARRAVRTDPAEILRET